jgi:hypothetical protein
VYNEVVTCTDAHVLSLWKIPPVDIYVNFTAGKQIQMNLSEAEQSFKGSHRKWAEEYRKCWVKQADQYHKGFAKKNIDPFRK